MGHRADDEIAEASAALGAACRKITALALEAWDFETAAATVHAMETLIDDVKTVFQHNAEAVAIADDLKRQLRAALWAEAEFTRQ